jgi:hypothetical protein
MYSLNPTRAVGTLATWRLRTTEWSWAACICGHGSSSRI